MRLSRRSFDLEYSARSSTAEILEHLINLLKKLTPRERGVSLLSARKHFLRFFNWCKSGVKLVGIGGQKAETHGKHWGFVFPGHL